MPSSKGQHREYRVTTYAWKAGADPIVCEIQGVQWGVVATTAQAAIEAAPSAPMMPNADRVVVDAQSVQLVLRDKTAPWAPWRVVVIWLEGGGELEESVRERVTRWGLRSMVTVDDHGNLGVAAGLSGYLDGEAHLDLEQHLESALEDLDVDLMDYLPSSVETGARAEEPTMAELEAELRSSGKYDRDEAIKSGLSRDLDEVEPEGPEDRERFCELLRAAAVNGFDPTASAERLGVARRTVDEMLHTLEFWGLLLRGEAGEPPLVLDAADQFLSRRGRVPLETLWFLPKVIDDLNAREALRRAGHVIMDELTEAVAAGEITDYVRQRIVPPAFQPVVDERLAARMFTAASALIARLTDGSPAACVAEEIVAVALIREAEAILELHEELNERETQRATSELRGIFELFEDDDVLNLFAMAEPADAAVAGHDPVNRQLGVADQRAQAWFDAFGGITPSGHLRGRALYRWP